MLRGRILATVAGIAAANAVLMGAALATSRPVYYLAVTCAAGTFVNLTYLVAGRLWQVRP